MATTTVQDRIEVSGNLEPGAIAGWIAADAHKRVAEAVTITVDSLEEDDNALNQLQKARLLEDVLRCMDGFERAVLDQLVRCFSRIERSGDGR